MEESSPDILAKYQKLAAEYSKMRAQIAVLKKAVAEEQTKGGEMKEVMKEKDQAIRKLQQEVECLNFRNIQLTKRVSVLQDDLEAVDEKLKKTKNKGSSNTVVGTGDTQSILNAELQSRIEENERLHQQVYVAEIERQKIVSDLTSQVDFLQSEIAIQRSHMNEKVSKLEANIEKLSQERARTEVTLKNYEKEMKDLKFKEETCKEELQFVQEDIRTKLQDTNRILEEKVLFNDTRFNYLNNLNVPILLRKKQEQLLSLMGCLQGMISDLVRRLSDLHTYMEQKINSVEQDNDISGAMKRFAGFLHENAQYLKIVETVFSDFTARINKDSSTWLDASNLKEIGVALSKYVRYLDKLLPYLILSIHTENCIRGTTPRLKDIYKKLQIVSQNLTYSFSKLERSVQLIVEVGSPSKNVTYHVSRPVVIKRIISSLDDLQMLFEEARKVFSAKVVIEHQLPTLTETTKNTDDCILSSIVSVASTFKKITGLMRKNMAVLLCEVPYLPRGFPGQKKLTIHPCISRFRERAFKYMELTHQDEPLSIPYEEALKNAQTLSSYEDNRDNLSQQLEMCKTKISKLELDKEHWMLEYQLLKTRQSSGIQSPTKGNCDTPAGDEEALQSFVRATVNQLVSQIQFADSKSIAFQAECDFLHQKLKLADQKKESLEQKLSESKETILCTKEEHKMMMKSYEDQLSTMSEHLATMNETLTSQKDEIDALKQAAGHKVSKKSKGK